MKKLLLGTLGLVAVISFSGCAGNGPDMKNVKFMNDTQINELFTDKTITGVATRANRPFELMFKSDGNVSGMVGTKNITGKWYVKNNEKCMTINSKTNCRKHYMQDGKYFTYDESLNVITSSFTVK